MKEYLRLFKLGFTDNLVKVGYVFWLLMSTLSVVASQWEDLLSCVLDAILCAPMVGVITEWRWYKDLINKDLDAIIQELEIDEQP